MKQRAKHFGKTGLAFLLALAVIVSGACGLFTVTARAADGEEAEAHLVINQVYGGSDDGYADHSFIELYNPTDSDVSLDGWSVQYKSSSSGSNSEEWEVLELGGTIPAEGYYLIRCAEVSDTSNVTYEVADYDMEWDMTIHNKGISVVLMSDTTQLTDDFAGNVMADDFTLPEGYVDLAAVQGNDSLDTQVPPAYETAYSDIQSKKNAIRRTDYADTDDNSVDFTTVNYSKTVSDAYAPHTSGLESNKTGGSGSDDAGDDTGNGTDENTETTYTAVETTDTMYTGYANGSADLSATLIARYNSGAMNADGGSSEIVAYNSVNGYAYSVNGVKGVIDVISMSGVRADTETLNNLEGSETDVSVLVADADETFTYGDMTSIAVSPDGATLAVALQDADYTKSGRVAFFACAEDGSLTYTGIAETGVQPDMVTFAGDGSYVLTADEGEPREGYTAEGAEDPAGTVSIITVSSMETKIADFTSYDTEEAIASLTEDGIILKADTNPSVDLEPEYIAVSGNKAYVSLQEANAIAVLDIESGAFTAIYSAGYEDYSSIAVDLEGGDGTYDPQTYENIRGIRMPDGISTVTIGTETYLLTANEGDSRAWGDESGENCNENKSKTSAVNGYSFSKKVTWFDTTYYTGLDENTDYVFGGRSFTLFKVTDDGLEEVYDSGNEFESITADLIPDYYNCSNDDNELESRSGKKGTEPESVTTGTVNGHTYAFIALERIGGVMIYDITDPENAEYVNYINSRDFSEAIKDDVSPEGLCFVSGSDDTQAMLLTANEVSGTVGVIALSAQTSNENDDSSADDNGATDSGNSYDSTSDDSSSSDSSSGNSSSTTTEDESSYTVITKKTASTKISLTGATESQLTEVFKLASGDGDFADSSYALLQAKAKTVTKKSVKVTWKKVSGAKYYVIYGNQCGTSNKYKKLKKVSSSKTSVNFKKVAGKSVKSGKSYKFIVVALDKNGEVIETSKTIHAVTKGGKQTNTKTLKAYKGSKKVTKVSVKKGKSVKIKTKATKQVSGKKLSKHRAVKYESSNKKIAKVNASGKITGVKKGTCTVYAYAANGVSAKVKVTVK